MSAFLSCMKFVERHEGGWSDDAHDPGGLTRWGVTLKTLRRLWHDLNGDGAVDGHDLRAMSRAQARLIYRQNYWDRCSCNFLPKPLALLVFDAAVNQGPDRAIRWLQEAVDAAPDGVFGAKTRRAVQRAWAAAPSRVLREIAVSRALHYASLRRWWRYRRGWMRRLIDCAMLASAWLAQSRTGPQSPAQIERAILKTKQHYRAGA